MTRVAAIAFVVVIVGAATWWFFSRTTERPGEGLGGSYADIKSRIRSGESLSLPTGAPPLKEPAKSLDTIFAMADADQFFAALVDRASDAAERVGWTGLRDGDRKFLLVLGLTGEVYNGGFDQYFFNSAGDHAQETPKALRDIGATKTLDIVERALTLFPGSAPDSNRERRWKQTDAWTEQHKKLLDALDREFYKLEEDVSALLVTWARKNRDQFS